MILRGFASGRLGSVPPQDEVYFNPFDPGFFAIPRPGMPETCIGVTLADVWTAILLLKVIR